jgi:hypothetical protein
MKKVRAALAAITGAVCIGNLCSYAFCNLEATAKVIEPEIVHTETWTTSYFIDDDMDTFYPYIDCQADIYNDGTMTVYYWNTHEWDGFATVSHKATIMNKTDISSCHINKSGTFVKLCYPVEYKYGVSYFDSRFECHNLTVESEKFIELAYYGTLPEMPVNSKSFFTFTPTVEPVGNYEFHILGHDIMITPEILSGNTVAIPQLTEQEKQIQALETENALLKAENERLTAMSNADSILRLDTDGNGIIDAKDASTILVIYAINSTGGDIKTLTELKEYIANKK